MEKLDSRFGHMLLTRCCCKRTRKRESYSTNPQCFNSDNEELVSEACQLYQLLKNQADATDFLGHQNKRKKAAAKQGKRKQRRKCKKRLKKSIKEECSNSPSQMSI